MWNQYREVHKRLVEHEKIRLRLEQTKWRP